MVQGGIGLNKQRIFSLVVLNKIDCTKSKLFLKLKCEGYIDKTGALTDENQWPNAPIKGHFTNFGEGFYIASYLSDVIESVLCSLPIIDLTDYVSKGQKTELKSILKNGNFIAAQLPFYFKDIDKYDYNASSQLREAYYRGNSIKLSYVFDARYCFSNSSRHDSMSGRKVQTIFGVIISVLEEEGELKISISCLAAGAYFDTHHAREKFYFPK